MKSPTRSVIAIFMLGTATGVGLTAAQQGAPIPLAPKELVNRPTNIVLRLSTAGVPSINDQPIDWSRLDAELAAIFDQRPEKILFVETAPTNRVADIRRILALATKRGIKVYALFNTRSPG